MCIGFTEAAKIPKININAKNKKNKNLTKTRFFKFTYFN